MLSSSGEEKERVMRKRQALSASISADALLMHEEQLKPSRRPVQFAITDILPGNQKTKAETMTLPVSPPALGPLSLPRPGKSDVLSPTNGVPPAAPKSVKKDLASPVQVTPSLESYAERLEQAENTELFTYTSALCHRVTGRYLPRALLQSDPEAQQRELERVQRDPEILRAIDSVRVLSAQFKDVAQNTMGHRRELGHSLFRIEESYLKLFEKLLELSLRLYWEYEQRTEAQRREDRATAERWREKYERRCTECVEINKKMAAREIIHRAREIELQDYREQMKETEKELGSQRELEAQILQLQDASALQRVLERKLRDDFAQLTKTHDEMLEYQKQLREELQAQHKQLINDLRRTVREKDRCITKQEVTLRQLEEIVAVPPTVYESRSSQTEVDDDGLWDVQVRAKIVIQRCNSIY
ncbi:EF-hand domain pair [Phytophthora cinnamomi]|uniref:EF-hand domain pair n=1 Tax=Phytophthora cinnamomi TaxID=4785 RepID=UPI003559B3DC|nr:EF-hand domain pair [Phytophthora cinnamomi]